MEASQITGQWHLATFTGGLLHLEADENVLVAMLGKRAPVRLYRQHTADGFWASEDIRIRRKGHQLCVQLRKGGAWGSEHLACRTTSGAMASFGTSLVRTASKTFVSSDPSSSGAQSKPRKKKVGGLLCCVSGSAIRANEMEPTDQQSGAVRLPSFDSRLSDSSYNGQDAGRPAEETNLQESFGDEFALPTRIDRTDYALPNPIDRMDYAERQSQAPAAEIRKPLLNGHAHQRTFAPYREYYIAVGLGCFFLFLIFLGWLYRNYD